MSQNESILEGPSERSTKAKGCGDQMFRMKNGSRGVWSLFFTILLVSLLWTAYKTLPFEAWSLQAIGFAKAEGALGVLLFLGLYILATVLLFPCAILTIAAGVMYGFWGLPLVLSAATIGASIAFLSARHFAYARVNALLDQKPFTRALKEALQTEGWTFMVLLRMSPLIPFNLNNYLLGTTPVRYGSYISAMMIGALPGSLLYIYLGTFGRGQERNQPLQWSLLILGVFAATTLGRITFQRTKAILSRQPRSSQPHLPEGAS